LPVLDRMAELMDEAYVAIETGAYESADAIVAEYRHLYEQNAENLI
jgi:hypothetical protein